MGDSPGEDTLKTPTARILTPLGAHLLLSPMAWRIRENVLSGEIDNRTKGRVSGFLEMAGGGGRILLDLEGNAHPDLAGSLIRFRNPRKPTFRSGDFEGFAREQKGHAGDITASHRVKDLLVSTEAFLAMDEEARSNAYRWANCLYLEWYGRTNGRIVMEGIGYEIEWVEGPLWRMSEEDLREQAERSRQAVGRFFDQVFGAAALEDAHKADDDAEEISPEEARADAEAARMDLLNDRIARRMRKEGTHDFDRFYQEESARLRRERGEPDPPPLTPEEEAARAEWIEEMNAAVEEAEAEAEAGSWKPEEREYHPLVADCHEFSLDLRKGDILPEEASDEHPLWEIANGVLFASGKLAGALNGCMDEEKWPPDELSAPSALVFLKKARRYLRDAMRGLDAADEENLVDPAWRAATRERLSRILAATQKLILEARKGLQGEAG